MISGSSGVFRCAVSKRGMPCEVGKGSLRTQIRQIQSACRRGLLLASDQQTAPRPGPGGVPMAHSWAMGNVHKILSSPSWVSITVDTDSGWMRWPSLTGIRWRHKGDAGWLRLRCAQSSASIERHGRAQIEDGCPAAASAPSESQGKTHQTSRPTSLNQWFA